MQSPDWAEAEAAVIRAFFGDRQHGYFVEVGANDPRFLSQTFGLEQRGWDGILIEPQPDLAETLRQSRKARVFAEACSSRRNSGSRMTLHLAGGHSSFDAGLNLPGVKPHGAASVPVRTLDEILMEASAHQIDFISIDVEGHELDVLDGFDLARWRPQLILIEDLLLDLRLHRYLSGRGYRWLRRTTINNWYIPAEHLPRRSLARRWQYFHKLYLGPPWRRLRMAWRRRRMDRDFVAGSGDNTG